VFIVQAKPRPTHLAASKQREPVNTSANSHDDASDSSDDEDVSPSHGLASCLRKIHNVIRTHSERFGGVIYYYFRVKGPVNTDVICDKLRRVVRHESLPMRFHILWAGILTETDQYGIDKYRFFHCSSNNTEILADTFVSSESFRIIRARLAGRNIVEELSKMFPNSKVKFVMLTNIVIKVFRRDPVDDQPVILSGSESGSESDYEPDY